VPLNFLSFTPSKFSNFSLRLTESGSLFWVPEPDESGGSRLESASGSGRNSPGRLGKRVNPFYEKVIKVVGSYQGRSRTAAVHLDP